MVLTYLGNQIWYSDQVNERPTGINNQAVTVELPTRRVYYYSGTSWEESAGGGGSGEVNTGSNVGTAGVGVFKQKNVFDFQFKKINAASNRVTITDDTANDEVDVNIAEANIQLQNLGGVLPYAKANLTNSVINTDISPAAAIAYSKLNLANSIGNADIATGAGIQYSKLLLTDEIVNADIDGSAAIAYGKLNLTNSIVNADVNSAAAIPYSKLNLTGGLVNADVNATAAIAWSKLNKTGSLLDDIENVDIPTPANNDVLTWSTSGNKWVSAAPPGASGGEANTITTIGTAGVSVYKQKTGVSFELKKINAGSTKITVTDDLVNNEVDIDIPTTAVFPSGTFNIGDSDASHKYIVTGSNLSADATLLLPAFTSTDVVLLQNLNQNIIGQKNFFSGSFRIGDASFTNYYIFNTSELTVDRTITIPALTQNDVPLYEAQTQTITGAKKFNTGIIKINAGAFTYQINSGTIAADTIMFLPNLTTHDTIVFEAQAQTLTNKTLGTTTISDATNIVLGSTTGTKIGTATTQKVGFFNVTPITQRSAITSPTADSAALKTAVDAIRVVLQAFGFTA